MKAEDVRAGMVVVDPETKEEWQVSSTWTRAGVTTLGLRESGIRVPVTVDNEFEVTVKD